MGVSFIRCNVHSFYILLTIVSAAIATDFVVIAPKVILFRCILFFDLMLNAQICQAITTGTTEIISVSAHQLLEQATVSVSLVSRSSGKVAVTNSIILDATSQIALSMQNFSKILLTSVFMIFLSPESLELVVPADLQGQFSKCSSIL